MTITSGVEQEMEQEKGGDERRHELDGDDLWIAQHRFGHLPREQWPGLLAALYREERVKMFGSEEKFQEHMERTQEYEAEMLADLAALDKRVRGL